MKMKSASSKPIWEVKGNQSVAGRAVGNAGGTSVVRNSPCSLHRLAGKAQKFIVDVAVDVARLHAYR